MAQVVLSFAVGCSRDSLPWARAVLNGGGGLALRARCGLRERAARLRERDLEDVLDRVGKDELEFVARLFGELLEIRLVVARDHDPLQAVALGREDLLADPADRQDLP